MKKKYFVHIVGADWAGYMDMFRSFGTEQVTFNQTRQLEMADIVCFTGGGDISPFLYGEEPHRTTHFSEQRDTSEILAYEQTTPKQLKVGICRGAQLLNVLNGGRLWQNVDRHTISHVLIDLRKNIHVEVSSLHHQMMIPTDKAEIIAIAYESSKKETDTTEIFSQHPNEPDIEAVFYKETNDLLVQYHPEFGGPECTKYFGELLFDQLQQMES